MPAKLSGQGLSVRRQRQPTISSLRFEVLGLEDTEPPQAKYIPASRSYERTHYRSITDKTMEYFLQDLKILGFHGNSFKLLDP